MKWESVMLSPSSYISNSSSWMMEDSIKNTTIWTPYENKLFENALAKFDKDTPDRWQRVSEMVPGKTVSDVIRQYKELEDDVSSIEAGFYPKYGYNCNTTSNFTLEWGNGTGNDGFYSPRFCAGEKRSSAAAALAAVAAGRPVEHERKKGVPWTEEEHKLFLLGLKKYGKGDWRNISRNFVVTRTPTQVASHAQKYFIRQLSGGKDKRRASIHDITTVNIQENQTSPEYKRATSPEQCKFKWNQPDSETTIMAFNQTQGDNLFMCPKYGGSPFGGGGGLDESYGEPANMVFQMHYPH
nr:transcription factor DIVARICATA [Tanacetum cinerariifolium]